MAREPTATSWPADKVERWPLSKLKAYERNARTHSDEQIAQLMASIKEFGFTIPVLADPKGVLIAGHARVEAARRLQLADVPVMVAKGWSDAQRRAYVLADNKLALNSSWDSALLQAELADLRALGVDLGITGFSEMELAEVLAPRGSGGPDADAVPAVEKKTVSRPGDVWLLGRHRVICGDSTSAHSMSALMQGELADLCWTDPPYNVAYSTKAGSIDNDDLSEAEFARFLMGAFGTVFGVMRPGACIYVAHADTEGLAFRAAFKAAGFKLSGCLIWEKDSLVLGRSDYQWQHEPILYGWKPGGRHTWLGGRKQTTIAKLGEASPFERIDETRWQVKVGDRIFVVEGSAKVEEFAGTLVNEAKPKRNPDHPTMKPVALIERQLRNHARSGNIVVDPFGGSGSTLMAAERLGLAARLVELDVGYCDVIVRRWQEFTGCEAKRDDGREFNAFVPQFYKKAAA